MGIRHFKFLAIKADSHQVGMWYPFCIMIIIILTRKNGYLIELQVGPGDDYTLTVGGFNDALSTLGDDMQVNNGKKFSTRSE